jgi:hypothetical protein
MPTATSGSSAAVASRRHDLANSENMRLGF